MKNNTQPVQKALPGKPFLLILMLLYISLNNIMAADDGKGEHLYKHLSTIVKEGNNEIIETLNNVPRTMDWSKSVQMDFKGHLRCLNSADEGSLDQTRLFFINKQSQL